MKKFITLLALGFLLSVTWGGQALASDSEANEGEGSSVQFIELNPLILPIITNNGGTRMVSLVVALEVDSQEKADQVTKYSPRLTDAYLSALYGSLSYNADDTGIIPIAYVKKTLNDASAKILGDHIVNDVLVQVLQNRRT